MEKWIDLGLMETIVQLLMSRKDPIGVLRFNKILGNNLTSDYSDVTFGKVNGMVHE